MAPARPRTLASGRVRHQPAQVGVGALVAIEFVELVLGEIADIKLLRPRDAARHRRELAGQELHQGRFAVAVGAQQRDAVVGIDSQRQLAQHRTAGLVTDRHVVDRDDGRRQHLGRRRKRDRPHLVVDDRGRRLELGQQLQPGLRLARLGGLGAEPVDERLQVLALRLLLLGELRIEQLALAARALERACSRHGRA